VEAGVASGKASLNLGTDTNLYRNAADVLKTDDKIIAARGFESSGAAGITAYNSYTPSTQILLDNRLTSSDTNPNFRITGDGKIQWGAGAGSALDTNLYRNAADVLKTDDALVGATTIDAIGGFKVNGTAGSTVNCSAGQYYAAQNVSGGIVTGGTCTTTSGAVTLDNAYANGNTITTTNARNLSVTLADTTTDANFITNIATGSTSAFKVQNNGTDVLSIGSAGQLSLPVTGSNGGIQFGGGPKLYTNGTVNLETDQNILARKDITANFGGAGEAALTTVSGSGGLVFNSDTNVYRSAANTLKTDDKLVAGATSSAKDQITIPDTTAGAGITLGGDTNLYRSGANILQTDDDFSLNGTSASTLTVGAGDADTGSWKTVWDGAGDRTYIGFNGSQGGTLQFYTNGTSTGNTASLDSAGTFSASTLAAVGNVQGSNLVDSDGFISSGSVHLCAGVFNVVSACSSSQTYKNTIVPVSEPQRDVVLQNIKDTDVFTYKRNEDGPNAVTHFGVIAERLPKELTPTKDHNGNPQPDFDAIAAYTWGGLKALAKDHDELVAQVQQLQAAQQALQASADANVVLSPTAQQVKELKVTDKLVTGTIIVEGDLVLDDNRKGANVEVPKGDRKLEVKFGRKQRDGNYTIQLTPSWVTAYGVTNKTDDGFTVEFDKKAPKGAKLDWTSIR
jgi:hypothetical protein